MKKRTTWAYRQHTVRNGSPTMLAMRDRLNGPPPLDAEQLEFLVRIVVRMIGREPRPTIPDIADELNLHSNYVEQALRQLGAVGRTL